MAFPRTPRVRLWYILTILARLFITLSLGGFIAAQVINPNLIAMVEDLKETNGVYTVKIFTEYGMRLSIANTYCWLLMFYSYFHLYLNLWAEILRFGDRVFYKDWWNSSEVGAYWRLWNAPVHYWVSSSSLIISQRFTIIHDFASFYVLACSAHLFPLRSNWNEAISSNVCGVLDICHHA
jgi:diacylglycerol O-acyltransferase-1